MASMLARHLQSTTLLNREHQVIIMKDSYIGETFVQSRYLTAKSTHLRNANRKSRVSTSLRQGLNILELGISRPEADLMKDV